MDRFRWTFVQTFSTLLWLFTAVVNVPVSASSKSAFYNKADLCDVTDKVSEGCMVPTTHTYVRSLVECSLLCDLGAQCTAVTWNSETGTCYLHTPCSTDTCVVQAESEFVYLEKVSTNKCQNDGLFNVDTMKCQYVGGWVGEDCERRPYTCEELHEYGYPMREQDFLVDIYRDQSKLIAIKCKLLERRVLTFLFKTNGRQRHNMTYSDFVYGYFINGNNFWIGLEHIKAFNYVGYEKTWMRVTFRSDGSHVYRFIYSDFQVGAASEGYPLTYRKVSHTRRTSGIYRDINITNCLNDLQGVPFSPWDHEITGNNCALTHGSGWWFYNDCSTPCNILGVKRGLYPDLNAEEYVRIPNLDMMSSTAESQLLHIELYFYEGV